MIKPEKKERRVSFMAVIIGMAKDFGYDLEGLIQDISDCWEGVND